MRIAILTFAVPWADRPTNGLYNVDQARALVTSGHNTELFTVAPCFPRPLRFVGGAVARQINRQHRYRFNGITINTVRAPAAYPHTLRTHVASRRPGLVASSFDRLAGPAMRRSLDTFAPDAIIIHGLLPWADLTFKYAERRGIPVIAIEHSQGDVLRINPGSALHRFYASRSCRCIATMTVGEAMDTHLRTLGVPNTGLIRNGVNTLANPSAARSSRTDTDNLVVLAAGQYIPRKGHRTLIDAFANASLGEAVLRFVGKPPGELIAHAARRGLGSRFQWLPSMPNEQLLCEMARADVFALPSWSEAFGLVFMEALGVGTPVIMTSDAGASSHVKQSVHGWVVPPRDVTAVSLALEAAARSGPERRHAMGHAGRAMVLRDFGWEQNARTLLAAFGLHSPGFHTPVSREEKEVA